MEYIAEENTGCNDHSYSIGNNKEENYIDLESNKGPQCTQEVESVASYDALQLIGVDNQTVSDCESNNNLAEDDSMFCMCCLSTSTTFTNIFNTAYEAASADDMEDSVTVSFSEIITSLTGIEMDEHESFEHLVCNDCILLLTSFFDFKLKAMYSYTVLKENTCTIFKDQYSIDSQRLEVEEVLNDCYINDYTENNSELEEDKTDVERSPEDVDLDLALPLEILKNLQIFDSEEKITLPNDPETNHLLLNSTASISSNFTHNKSYSAKRKQTQILPPRPKSRKLVPILPKSLTKSQEEEVIIIQQECNNTQIPCGTDKSVACEICGKVLSSMQVLKKHLMLHFGKKFQCSVCNKGFTDNYELKQHMNIHEMKQIYACDHCDLTFLTSTQLKHHKADVRRREKFTCQICMKSMPNQERYLVHMTNHKENADELKPFTCSDCGKRFLFESYLTKHQMSHSQDKPVYTCDICGKCLSSEQNLKKHLMLHLGKEFQCTVCNKEFTEKYDLKMHMNIHEKKDNFLCSHCGKIFLTAIQLRAHKNALERRKYFTCHKCGKSMSNKASYEIHLTTHQNSHEVPKVLKCNVCGKKFAHQLLLKNHLWYHNSKYRCLKCYVIYNEPELKTHDCQPKFGNPFTDFSPNECQLCGKIMLDSNKLEVHMRKHEDRKCDQCEMVFLTSRELRFHMNKHNIRCQHCNRGFIKKNNLEQHLQKGVCMRNKQYSCPKCNKTVKMEDIEAHTCGTTDSQSVDDVNFLLNE